MAKADFRLELITPDGESYDLHVPPDRVAVRLTGYGMSEKDMATTRGPYQQGSSILSQRLNERKISFSMFYKGYSRDGYLDHRLTLVDYLRENRSELYDPEPYQLIYHYIHNGSYIQRALDVQFESGMAFTPPQAGAWDNFSLREDVVFVALNPVIYDPTQQSSAFSSFESELVLPATFPITFGTYWATKTVTYTGTWEEYPVIEVHGPAKNFSILNTSTDKRINYEGTVNSNKTVTIDLAYDQKRAYDDCAELTQYLSGDLGTFSLLPDPLLTDGDNVLQFYTESYDPASTTATLKYYLRYRGI